MAVTSVENIEHHSIGHNSGDPVGELEYRIETITPEMAAEYLRHANPEIKEDKKAVADYAAAMSAEAWVTNGMPIVFDRQGNLLDGYHRLRACVEAGVDFESFIATNADAESLHTIDQHRRRAYTHVLESRGVKNAGAVLRTVSALIRIENGVFGKENKHISWIRLNRVLDANPEIFEATQLAEESRGSHLRMTPRPVLCYMALAAGQRKELRTFLSALRTPDEYEFNHPGAMVARQFKSLRNLKVKIDPQWALAISIMAFNDLITGNMAKENYEWEPDYGKDGIKKVQIDDSDSYEEVIDRAYVLEHGPDNLGMPVVDGYPGLKEGRFNPEGESQEFFGELAETLRNTAKEGHGDAGVKMHTITPGMAQDLLAKYNKSNRKLQMNHVAMIARDIREGNWMVNAQPICFAGDPYNPGDDDEEIRLLNGQHRLRACYEADTAIEVPISVNIPPAAFATYDIQKKGTKAIIGAQADDRVLRGAAKFTWREEQGLPLNGRDNPTATEMMDVIREHPGLIEAFPEARKMEKIAPSGVTTYLIERVTREDPVLGPKFIEELKDGFGLVRGNPVSKVREKALANRKNQARKSVLLHLLKGWDDYKKWAKVETQEKSTQQELL